MKTHKCNRYFKMFTLAATAFTLSILLTTSASGDDMMDEATASRLTELAGAANAFRLVAARDPHNMTRGIGDFNKMWKDNVLPSFQNDTAKLPHFFAFSMLMAGRLDGTQAVVGYYNPWVDAVLLTAWQERRVDGWRVADFEWLTGETFRGEKIPQGTEAILPAWLRSGKGAAPSVIEITGKTIARFEQLFPVKAPYGFPMVEPAENSETELGVNKIRMLFRQTSAIGLIEGEHAEVVQEQIKAASAAMVIGAEEAIQAVTGPEQDPQMADTIASLPEEIRVTMRFHAGIASESQRLIIFTSRLAPRWFILAFIDVSKEDQPLRGLQLYDFELMRKR